MNILSPEVPVFPPCVAHTDKSGSGCSSRHTHRPIKRHTLLTGRKKSSVHKVGKRKGKDKEKGERKRGKKGERKKGERKKKGR